MCNNQAVAGSFGSDVAPIKVEPQVAVVCDVRNPLHPQYMDSTGKWVSDLDNKNSCLKDKIEILDFCRKVTNNSTLKSLLISLLLSVATCSLSLLLLLTFLLFCVVNCRRRFSLPRGHVIVNRLSEMEGTSLDDQ